MADESLLSSLSLRGLHNLTNFNIVKQTRKNRHRWNKCNRLFCFASACYKYLENDFVKSASFQYKILQSTLIHVTVNWYQKPNESIETSARVTRMQYKWLTLTIVRIEDVLIIISQNEWSIRRHNSEKGKVFNMKPFHNNFHKWIGFNVGVTFCFNCNSKSLIWKYLSSFQKEKKFQIGYTLNLWFRDLSKIWQFQICVY